MEEEIKEAEEDEEINEKGKLITKEEREKGAVALRVYLSYAKACGPLFVFIALFLAGVAQGRLNFYYYKHRTKRKFPPTYIRIHSKQMNRC